MITIRQRRVMFGTLKYSVLSVLALVTVGIPLWLIVVNSFKPLEEAIRLNLALPQTWAIAENYRTVFEEGNYLLGLKNSILLVVPSVLLIVLLSGAAAWVFGRDSRRSTNVLYFLLISGVLIPPAIVTTIVTLRNLGIGGTHVGAIAFYVGTSSAFAIFLVTGFVRTIPREIEEAARIDGAGPLATYMRVVLPLLVPIMATTATIMLLLIWNDFFYPIFLLPGAEQQTLTLGLSRFVSIGKYQVSWNLVFADVVAVSLPLFVVFLVAQKRIVSGLTGGVLK
ncbi:MAG: carbohydrate ABC transporter permease [Acidimicrobiia bacterium]